jgi:hypothetical protein
VWRLIENTFQDYYQPLHSNSRIARFIADLRDDLPVLAGDELAGGRSSQELAELLAGFFRECWHLREVESVPLRAQTVEREHAAQATYVFFFAAASY